MKTISACLLFVLTAACSPSASEETSAEPGLQACSPSGQGGGQPAESNAHPAELVGTWYGFTGYIHYYELTLRADGTESAKRWGNPNREETPDEPKDCRWQVSGEGRPSLQNPWVLQHSCGVSKEASLKVVSLSADAFTVSMDDELETFERQTP